MTKYILIGTAVVIILSLIVGCLHLFRVAQKNKKELNQYSSKEIKYTNNLGKTLVVYYSLSGNTKQIAANIASKAKAEVFEIKTTEPMQEGLKFHLEIKQQLKNKKYPSIQEKLPDFNDYDTIFVGFPVWWYTMATPVFEFLQRADFKNKKVVPFSTQGSNYGTSFADFKNLAKNAKIGKEQSFNNVGKKYDNAVDNKISTWLNDL